MPRMPQFAVKTVTAIERIGQIAGRADTSRAGMIEIPNAFNTKLCHSIRFKIRKWKR